MDWYQTPYAIALLIMAITSLVVAGLAWRRRGPGAVAFAVVLIAVAWWEVCYGLELASMELAQKVLWAKIQYIGIVLIPVAWLVFSLQYSGLVARLDFVLLSALMVLPASTLTILWSPSTESLIWRQADLSAIAGVGTLRLAYGPWFWVHTAFSYLLWAIATVIVLRAMSRSPHLYRKQALAVIVMMLSPWALNVVHVAGLSPVPLDPTPLGFTLTGLVAFWTLARRQFLDIMPIARARVVEGIRDGVVVLDVEDRVVDLNPAAEEIINQRASAALGRHFEAALDGRVDLRDLIEEGNDTHPEVVLRVGGVPKTHELRSWPLFDRRDTPCGRVILFRDVTARLEAEEALRSSEQRLRVVVEQMPAVLWTTDAALRVTQMLGAALEDLQVPSMSAQGIELAGFLGAKEVDHPALAAHEAARAGESSTYSVAWFGRDFECHVEPFVDGDGSVCGIIGVGLDVTEREDLQQQLRQSQRMEAIGRMAGGVAHDFNNLLTAVTGYAQLAQEDLDEYETDPSSIRKLRSDIDAIEHASQRATSITAQLLAFSRRKVLQPELLSLNRVVDDMNEMVRRLIGEHIELSTDLDDELRSVKADPGQIQQVMINLILNSRDAMPKGGRISIETSNLDLVAGRPIGHDRVEPGKYVVLTVADDGLGMEEHILPQVFEPFFTTKEEGKGTGLGLSTVNGIVKQSGGHIGVESRPGAGARFQIYFPAVEERAPKPLQVAEPAEGRARGTETILLVEDEEIVRVLASRVLSGSGYLVLEAEDGEEALEVCRRHEGPIALVVADVVMPGMNGRDLAEKLAVITPESAVLFISGYTGGALVEHGVLRDGTEFLQKPFSPRRLTERVREILGKRD